MTRITENVGEFSYLFVLVCITEVIVVVSPLFDCLREVLVVGAIGLVQDYPQHGLVGLHRLEILVITAEPVVISPVVALQDGEVGNLL